MQNPSSAPLSNRIFSLPQTLGILLLSLLCGLLFGFGILLANLGTTLIGILLGFLLCPAAILLGSLPIFLLARRRSVFFGLTGALVYSAVAALIAPSFITLILSLAAWAGGLYMAYAVEKGEGRVTATASVAFLLLVILVALIGYFTFVGAQAAGESDPIRYLGNQLDYVADEVTAVQIASYELLYEFYEQAETDVQILIPTEGEIRLTVVRAMSLLPGVFVLCLLVLALTLTYLVQLLALASSGESAYAPLFRQENRVYRVGAVFTVLYLFVWLAARFWMDFSSPACLVLQNAALVLTPVMAFGGILRIPAFFRFLRQGNAGRRVSRVWRLLFVLLCISYLRYAVTIFSLAYAVYILKNAFSRKSEEK